MTSASSPSIPSRVNSAGFAIGCFKRQFGRKSVQAGAGSRIIIGRHFAGGIEAGILVNAEFVVIIVFRRENRARDAALVVDVDAVHISGFDAAFEIRLILVGAGGALVVLDFQLYAQAVDPAEPGVGVQPH